jgi:single-strand DNA-binding protein
MFNLAILTGRLTSDPELKTTPSGVSVTSFSIAVNRPYRKDKEAETDFINIVAWRQTAEFITHYFTKGSLIGIEGSIQTRKYQDKDGTNRTAFEVVANNVDFVMPKSTAERAANEDTVNSPNEPQSFSNGDSEDFEQIDMSDDDLPF